MAPGGPSHRGRSRRRGARAAPIHVAGHAERPAGRRATGGRRGRPGREQASMRRLQSALVERPRDPRLAVALATAHLARGEPARALGVVEGLEPPGPLAIRVGSPARRRRCSWASAMPPAGRWTTRWPVRKAPPRSSWPRPGGFAPRSGADGRAFGSRHRIRGLRLRQRPDPRPELPSRPDLTSPLPPRILPPRGVGVG